MQFIDKIETMAQLNSYQEELGKAISKQTGNEIEKRQLEEIVAESLGVKDYDTAVQIISNKNSNKLKFDPMDIKVWHFLLSSFSLQGYADRTDIQNMLDEVVFDCLGSSKDVSDKINNQGWSTQIKAILEFTGGEYRLINGLADVVQAEENTVEETLRSARINVFKHHSQDIIEENSAFDLKKILKR